MEIVYLADPRINNGRYRAVLPMAALAERGHIVRRLFTEDAKPLDARIEQADVLFVHRYSDRRTLELVQRAKRAGVAVVWDDDDDSGSMPRSSPTYKQFGGLAWERRLASLRKLFGYVDLATAPSRVLAERFKHWGAPSVDIVENYLPTPSSEPLPRNGTSGLTIGWIAGQEHAVDVEHLPIVDVLQRILDERGDVRVITVGVKLTLRSDRYEHIPRVPIFELQKWAARFDMAIAPLADVDFNRSRSNIKLKEYAAAGVPWLASPIGPYEHMSEHQGGRLVPDGQWHEALSRLLDKPRERRKLGKRAARWAAKETIRENAGVWEAKLGAAGRVRPN